ncbi:diguanylate cyclase [Bacillus sp. BGMRC 2118]|nr:diguanylate cyclase [Bacillus sp. BGMRC 2118]
MNYSVSLTNQALLNSQNTVLRMLVQNAPFRAVITKIVQSLEELLPGFQFAVHVNMSNHIISSTQEIPAAYIDKLINSANENSTGNWLPVNVEEVTFPQSDRIQGYNACLYKSVVSIDNSQQGTFILFLQEDHKLTSYEDSIIQYFFNLVKLAFERKQETLYKEVYHLVENNISDLITVIDLQGTILFASASHEQILGYHPNELSGRKVRDFLHPHDQEWIHHFLDEISKSETTILRECRLFKKNRNEIIVESKGVLVKDENDSMSKIVLVSRDITVRKEAEATIKFMAYHDPLTGIPNRRKLKDKLEKQIRESKRNQTSFSILFVDLDNFKMINDEYGHEMGDDLLIKVTERMTNFLPNTCFLARWGGDEFTIIIPESDDEYPHIIATNLLEEMSGPFIIEGKVITITPSIGISVFPRDGEDVKTLFEKADKAMYWAKDKGKNNVITYHI